MGNSSRQYSIVISEQVLEMLVSHTRFLANVSNEAAEKLIKAFERAAESLQIMPEGNPWLDDNNLPINKYRNVVTAHNAFDDIIQIRSSIAFPQNSMSGRKEYGLCLAMDHFFYVYGLMQFVAFFPDSYSFSR